MAKKEGALELEGTVVEVLPNAIYFYTGIIDESIGRVQALIGPVLTVV